MRKMGMMHIAVLVLLAATVFSTGVIFADTGNTSSGTFQERVQERLNAAVAEGKITSEEAAEKLAKFEERVVSGGKFRGPRFGHGGGNGQNNNVNTAVYQGV